MCILLYYYGWEHDYMALACWEDREEGTGRMGLAGLGQAFPLLKIMWLPVLAHRASCPTPRWPAASLYCACCFLPVPVFYVGGWRRNTTPTRHYAQPSLLSNLFSPVLWALVDCIPAMLPHPSVCVPCICLSIFLLCAVACVACLSYLLLCACYLVSHASFSLYLQPPPSPCTLNMSLSL